jgi:hypothetical protein
MENTNIIEIGQSFKYDFHPDYIYTVISKTPKGFRTLKARFADMDRCETHTWFNKSFAKDLQMQKIEILPIELPEYAVKYISS